MKLKFFDKKNNLKDIFKMKTTITKKLVIKKIKDIATKPLISTKASLDGFYKNYKKLKEKEELKKENRFKLEKKKELIEEKR